MAGPDAFQALLFAFTARAMANPLIEALNQKAIPEFKAEILAEIKGYIAPEKFTAQDGTYPKYELWKLTRETMQSPTLESLELICNRSIEWKRREPVMWSTLHFFSELESHCIGAHRHDRVFSSFPAEATPQITQ